MQMKKIIGVVLFVFATNLMAGAYEGSAYSFLSDSNRYTPYEFDGEVAKSFIEKDSIVFNSKKQIFEAWVVRPNLGALPVAFFKTKYLFNVKSNKVATKQVRIYDDSGRIVEEADDGAKEWRKITPGSDDEACLRNIKKLYKK